MYIYCNYIFLSYIYKRMPKKAQKIFRLVRRRPIDHNVTPSTKFSTKAPPAKYYRKERCPPNCDNTYEVNDVFGNVRTCKKVIGGSKGCIPLNANTMINANVPTGSNGFPTKKYYTSNAEYMKARCMTYNQKQFHFTTGPGGSLEANCCGNEAGYVSGNCRAVVYKPNNSKFSTQGAVSSSSRLVRLKYNTITNSSGPNRNSCTDCQRYPAGQTNSNMVKSTICNRHFRLGNKNAC